MFKNLQIVLQKKLKELYVETKSHLIHEFQMFIYNDGISTAIITWIWKCLCGYKLEKTKNIKLNLFLKTRYLFTPTCWGHNFWLITRNSELLTPLERRAKMLVSIPKIASLWLPNFRDWPMFQFQILSRRPPKSPNKKI